MLKNIADTENGIAKNKFVGKSTKVFLIGDSIREGYCSFVKEELKGKLDVVYPNDNCRFTQYVLTSLLSWVNMFSDRNEVKIVCFNCGHWDVAHWNGQKYSLNTKKEYARNLKRITAQLHSFFPCAKIIFFTTAPINEKLYNSMINPRTNKEIDAYNTVAVKTLGRLVTIKDMHKFIEGFEGKYYADYAHFNEEGNKLLGKYVAEIIVEELKIN